MRRRNESTPYKWTLFICLCLFNLVPRHIFQLPNRFFCDIPENTGMTATGRCILQHDVRPLADGSVNSSAALNDTKVNYFFGSSTMTKPKLTQFDVCGFNQASVDQEYLNVSILKQGMCFISYAEFVTAHSLICICNKNIYALVL